VWQSGINIGCNGHGMLQCRTGSIVSKQWGKAACKYFLDFLRETHFPDFARHGEQGSPFEDTEWLIRLDRGSVIQVMLLL
jgi:hypothetical protein